MGFDQCHETYPYLILSHVCTHTYWLVDRRYHCICILLVIICNKPSSQKPLTNQQGYQQLFPHVFPIQIAMYGMLIPFYLRLSSFSPTNVHNVGAYHILKHCPYCVWYLPHKLQLSKLVDLFWVYQLLTWPLCGGTKGPIRLHGHLNRSISFSEPWDLWTNGFV